MASAKITPRRKTLPQCRSTGLAFGQRLWPHPDSSSAELPDMAEAWSREEVEAAVADYFTMLGKELREEAYNKAEHNRQLQQLLRNRPRGSIERKHQNISAVLLELGFPYIDGYKPLRNYQGLLRSVIEDRLSGATSLHQAVAWLVAAEVALTPTISDLLAIEVPPPAPEAEESGFMDQPRAGPKLVRRNYLELEARNQSLGRAGEELVLRFERERLWRAGRRDLANRIEHVAQSQGDHLGFDVLSFELGGQERFIEVKTTRFGALTPFFASRNEVDVSEEHEVRYQLYRVFNFRAQPKLFKLAGSLRNSCRLDPVSFSAVPR